MSDIENTPGEIDPHADAGFIAATQAMWDEVKEDPAEDNHYRSGQYAGMPKRGPNPKHMSIDTSPAALRAEADYWFDVPSIQALLRAVAAEKEGIRINEERVRTLRRAIFDAKAQGWQHMSISVLECFLPLED